MKKFLIIILLTISLIFSGAILKAQSPIDEIQKLQFISDELSKHTVRILAINPDIFGGTGIVIDKDDKYTYILACKHLLELTKEDYIDNLKVKYYITIPGQDLMLIIVDGILEDKIPVKLAKVNESINNEIYFVGNVYFEKHFSTGDILYYSEEWGFANFYVKKGFSGGGIFNENKELVGILFGGIFEYSLAMFEPIEDINNFLEQIKEIIK